MGRVLIFATVIICCFQSCENNVNVKKDFYDNGVLKHEGVVLNNKNEGLHKWYFENGELEVLANYYNGNKNGINKFYYNENGALQYMANYLDDNIIDTAFYYTEDGNIEALHIYDSIGILLKKVSYSESGKYKEILLYVHVHFIDEPYLNQWIIFDTITDQIISKESNYYTIVNDNNEYVKDSISALKVIYKSFFKKNHRLIYGNIRDDFSYEDFSDTLITINNSQSIFEFPISTSNIGKNKIRFIIDDYVFTKDSTVDSKQTFIEYEYNVFEKNN